MKYGIEIRIGKTWAPARPPTAPPYEFGSREEAETMARVLFPEDYLDPEAVKIIPTSKESA